MKLTFKIPVRYDFTLARYVNNMNYTSPLENTIFMGIKYSNIQWFYIFRFSYREFLLSICGKNCLDHNPGIIRALNIPFNAHMHFKKIFDLRLGSYTAWVYGKISSNTLIIFLYEHWTQKQYFILELFSKFLLNLQLIYPFYSEYSACINYKKLTLT